MTEEQDLDKVYRQGMEAWERLKKEESWEDWLKVGHTHIAAREKAMHKAGTNRPEGRGYNTEFGKWLAEYKFDDMDKGDRSRLFTVMDNLPAIEAWRKTLTQTERLKLNHPSSVLRKWKRETQTPEEEKPTKKTQREANIELDEENHDLKEHIKEIEAGYEQLKTENDSLRADVATKDTYIKHLESQLATQTEATTVLGDKYNTMSKVNYELRQENAALKQDAEVIVAMLPPEKREALKRKAD